MERASSGSAASSSSSSAKGKYYMNVMGCQMNLAVRPRPLNTSCAFIHWAAHWRANKVSWKADTSDVCSNWV